MSKNIFYFILFSISLIGSKLSVFENNLKYLKYTSILLGLIWVFDSGLGLKKNFFKLNAHIYAFLLLIFSGIVRINQYNPPTLTFILILFASLFPFLWSVDYKLNIKHLNYIVFLGIPLSIRDKFVIDFNATKFGLSNVSSIESNILPFIIGLFAVYTFVNKKRTLFLLNVIALVLTFKRMAIIGMIFSLLGWFFFKRIRYLYLLIFALSINVGWIFMSYYITTDDFFDYTKKVFKMHPAEITTGRSALNLSVFETSKSLKFYLKGGGEGYAEQLSRDKYNLLLHNDILSILVNHGIIIFVLFIYLLYRSSKYNKDAIGLILFLNLSFFTDNTRIYTPVMFCFYLLMNELYKNQKLYLLKRQSYVKI